MAPKYCVRCGKRGPFATRRSQLCKRCQTLRKGERDERQRMLYRARHAAHRRLREEYAERWAELMKEELRREERGR